MRPLPPIIVGVVRWARPGGLLTCCEEPCPESRAAAVPGTGGIPVQGRAATTRKNGHSLPVHSCIMAYHSALFILQQIASCCYLSEGYGISFNAVSEDDIVFVGILTRAPLGGGGSRICHRLVFPE